MRKTIIFSLAVIPLLMFAGCGSGNSFEDDEGKRYLVYYDYPRALEVDSIMEKTFEIYTPYLKDKVIFLDPGHGGEDRYGRGPKDIAVEADVNLNVALELRDFLQRAGVKVIMSREEDVTVGLKERSYMANDSNADIFISIHHNAPGGSGNDWTNYTSTYYHATEDDYEYEPFEHDLARYVQRDLAYAMRNSGGLGSFDGTYSDYWIYPGAGFSVLRVTEIPAILIEGGFFTHNMEEYRLGAPEFNKIQAWGIFKGIAKFFRTGYPRIRFIGKEFINEEEYELNYTIIDTTGINPESIEVYVDSAETKDFIFSEDISTLSLYFKAVDVGEHIVRIVASNKNGIHSYPFNHEIIIKRED